MTVSYIVEITGFAAPYGVPNKPFNELLTPRCFQGLLPRHPIPMLWEHQRDMRIGWWTDLWEDHRGIWCRGELSRQLYTNSQDIQNCLGLSISWIGSWDDIEYVNRFARQLKGWPLVNVKSRNIRQLEEISLTKSGAYPGTNWSITET